MYRKLAVMAISIFLLGSVFAPQARADEGNKAILFTINQPVDIPGAVIGPGRYELKLLGFGDTVAGVWSPHGQKLYGFVGTTFVSRSHGISHARLDLSKPHSGELARIKDWYYPGDDYGYRLAYPASQTQLAQSSTNSVHGK